MTQALTAHGFFRAFTKRKGKDDVDKCIYCTEVDTAEHTIFECIKWNDFRETTYGKLGCVLTHHTLTNHMMESEKKLKDYTLYV